MKPARRCLTRADAIVDVAAVRTALRTHRLKSYLCDFPSEALLAEPGVVALPPPRRIHRRAERTARIMVADQVRESWSTHDRQRRQFPSCRDAAESPTAWRSRTRTSRNMLGQMSTAMARAGLTSTTW